MRRRSCHAPRWLHGIGVISTLLRRTTSAAIGRDDPRTSPGRLNQTVPDDVLVDATPTFGPQALTGLRDGTSRSSRARQPQYPFPQVLGNKAANKLLRRVVFHYTPKHACWLNMAESEIGILDRQRLNRRLSDRETLASEVDAWQRRRNDERRCIEWTFTRQDADHKMSRHYVSYLMERYTRFSTPSKSSNKKARWKSGCLSICTSGPSVHLHLWSICTVCLHLCASISARNSAPDLTSI